MGIERDQLFEMINNLSEIKKDFNMNYNDCMLLSCHLGI